MVKQKLKVKIVNSTPLYSEGTVLEVVESTLNTKAYREYPEPTCRVLLKEDCEVLEVLEEIDFIYEDYFLRLKSLHS